MVRWARFVTCHYHRHLHAQLCINLAFCETEDLTALEKKPMPISETRIGNTHDKPSPIDFLVDDLNWNAPPDVPAADMFYDYSADELRLDKKTGSLAKTVSQEYNQTKGIESPPAICTLRVRGKQVRRLMARPWRDATHRIMTCHHDHLRRLRVRVVARSGHVPGRVFCLLGKDDR
jgi:hypothetical protein